MPDYSQFFQYATGCPPYPYQRRLATLPFEDRSISVPTGAGKTAAVIIPWLYRIARNEPGTPRRLAYCLPMRVLVEQTRDNVNNWIARTGVNVEVATLMGGEVDQDWEIHPEKPFILIGTQDMLLSRALNRGYAMKRFRWPVHFGHLNNDCLWICDEVQLMGDGLATSTQLAAFRRRYDVFGECPTIWMSATMDSSLLASVDHPQPPDTFMLECEDFEQESLSRRLKAVKRLAKAPEKCRRPAGLAEFLIEKHKPGSQTIAVVNTVNRARETYDAITKIAAGVACHLLHSRFRPNEKKAWQPLFEDQPPESGRILIATQVIEAGVDISSAVLVTDLAPWSSLVQRFGRCNRAAELQAGADVFWIDRPLLATAKDADGITEETSRPYSINEVAEAGERLADLVSATPSELPEFKTTYTPNHVLRRRDLIDFFDTSADLSGYDLDVSRFVRSEQDRDVLVAWRKICPPIGKDAPTRDELCSAPIGDVSDLLKSSRKGKRRPSFYTWNSLSGQWERVEADRLYPGMILVADAASGCYDIMSGWDPASAAPVPQVERNGNEATEEEANEDDPGTFQKYTQTLAAHSHEVREEMRKIIQVLNSVGVNLTRHDDDLLIAANHHDWGKAHPVFQQTVNPERLPALLAKSKNRRKHKRPYFRHELASALALLQIKASDLSAYLAAAHHGKIRLSIRALPEEHRPDESNAMFARGIWEGDQLPAVELDDTVLPPLSLDLEPMLLGSSDTGVPSWTDRMLRLRDQVGLFRLAYLEALIVAADCRASADPKEVLQ